MSRGGIVKGKAGRDNNLGLIDKRSDIINPNIKTPLNEYYYGKQDGSRIKSYSELKDLRNQNLENFAKGLSNTLRPKDQAFSNEIQNFARGNNLDVPTFGVDNKAYGTETKGAVDSLILGKQTPLTSSSAPQQQNIDNSTVENNKLEPKEVEKPAITQSDNITNNISININVDKTGEISESVSGAETAGMNEAELAQKIKSAILNVIREEKRPGGELN